MRMRVIVNKIQSAHALQKCPLRGAVPDGEIDKIASAHAHSCAHAHITEPTRFGRGAAKDRTVYARHSVERERARLASQCPLRFQHVNNMAYYAGEDDYYQEQPDTMDDHMEERLVEALGYHVQDSVNQAIINALKPFAQPLRHFGQRELRGRLLLDAGPQTDQLSDLGLSQGALKRPLFSADILANMAASVMQDHGYDIYSSWDMSDTGREASSKPEGLSSPSPSSGSDQDHDDPKPMGKRKLMIFRNPVFAFYDRCDAAQFCAFRWEKFQRPFLPTNGYAVHRSLLRSLRPQLISPPLRFLCSGHLCLAPQASVTTRSRLLGRVFFPATIVFLSC
ncbi:hypothetical protein NDU88_003100 [Pleurodeles waltl]|uniref:Uncharacterized protein n=1 Tax=Pleurodeles waltl TaxID=8319 RepID=A0AAV7MZ79_PLEWA|nr:hypothetical protein NDU88_003100 [Pleurodeles waltl]